MKVKLHSSSIAALFGRSDVARILGVPQWLIGNLADTKKYRYGIKASVPGKGRGRKALYTLTDVYKIAVARRMHEAGLSSRATAEAIRTLFPKRGDLFRICVEQRSSRAEDARYLLWREGQIRPRLLRRDKLTQTWKSGEPMMAFVLPFDALLDWVDGRIFGRSLGGSS